MVPRAIGEAGSLIEQPFDAAKTGACLLQILHLVADLLGRLAQHFRVAKDEEDRPDRQRAVAVEHGAEGEGERHPQPEEALAGRDHAVAAHLSADLGGKPATH